MATGLWPSSSREPPAIVSLPELAYLFIRTAGLATGESSSAVYFLLSFRECGETSASSSTSPADAASSTLTSRQPRSRSAKKDSAKKDAPKVPAPGSAGEEAAEPTLDDDATDEQASAPAAAVTLPEGAVASAEDGSGPEGYTVKGNADSGKYHVDGSQWYEQTIAEFWFKDAEAAEAAGFEPAGGAAKQQVDDEA